MAGRMCRSLTRMWRFRVLPWVMDGDGESMWIPPWGCPPLPQNMRTSLALLRYSFLSIRI
jgi:hypothetical protein